MPQGKGWGEGVPGHYCNELSVVHVLYRPLDASVCKCDHLMIEDSNGDEYIPRNELFQKT